MSPTASSVWLEVQAFDPVARTLYAYDDFDGDVTICRRQLDTDSLMTVQPIGENRLRDLALRPDGSELVGEVYGSGNRRDHGGLVRPHHPGSGRRDPARH